jgi:predicted Rossmann fold flavoprotein
MSTPLLDHHDVIVIGGGGAGLFCAFTAANRGKKVLLLEHNERIGKKIEISGGGRCNFTNIHATAANYLSGNPDFCKSALARYTPWDFLSLVDKHGIAYHEKKLGQQFCDGSSRQIIAMLEEECREAGVRILCNCRVEDVTKPGPFSVMTSRGLLTADAVVVATGGLSFPKLGATDIGHRIARSFGIGVTTLRPGLVPLTFPEKERPFYEPLAGVSLPVRVSHGGKTFEEALLFTHRGVSGPAILQISSYWRDGSGLSFDLLPDREALTALTSGLRSGSTALQILSKAWPRRFAESWCERHAPEKPLARCTKAETDALLREVHGWEASLAGTEGYPKAEVTLGGVETGELSSKTMEARKVPGLHFIGEVVDVTGWLGGYNFQWAWASAHACGISL